MRPLFTPTTVPVTSCGAVVITSAESMMKEAPGPIEPAEAESVTTVVDVNEAIVYQVVTVAGLVVLNPIRIPTIAEVNTAPDAVTVVVATVTVVAEDVEVV